MKDEVDRLSTNPRKPLTICHQYPCLLATSQILPSRFGILFSCWSYHPHYRNRYDFSPFWFFFLVAWSLNEHRDVSCRNLLPCFIMVSGKEKEKRERFLIFVARCFPDLEVSSASKISPISLLFWSLCLWDKRCAVLFLLLFLLPERVLMDTWLIFSVQGGWVSFFVTGGRVMLCTFTLAALALYAVTVAHASLFLSDNQSNFARSPSVVRWDEST